MITVLGVWSDEDAGVRMFQFSFSKFHPLLHRLGKKLLDSYVFLH